MKAVFLTIFAALLFSVNAFGETARIRLGQERTVRTGRLHIKFDRIVEDSRCPMNARCIQAGNAKVQLTVSQGRSSKKIELNSNDGGAWAEIFGCKITFTDLNPQKGAPRDMSRGPKTVTVEVERSGS